MAVSTFLALFFYAVSQVELRIFPAQHHCDPGEALQKPLRVETNLLWHPNDAWIPRLQSSADGGEGTALRRSATQGTSTAGQGGTEIEEHKSWEAGTR